MLLDFFVVKRHEFRYQQIFSAVFVLLKGSPLKWTKSPFKKHSHNIYFSQPKMCSERAKENLRNHAGVDRKRASYMNFSKSIL